MQLTKPLFIVFALALLSLTGCAEHPPKHSNNICSIFKEKRDWFKASLKAQKKWGVPLSLPMAFMYQESRYQYDALPPRAHILGFIPWGRVSSSYGFSQAQKGTWKAYIRETGNTHAKRDNFADSVDFISWYIDKTYKINGIKKSDVYHQYLNYHEGTIGFRNRTYDRKPWLKGVSRKVANRAQRYQRQYQQCEQQLLKPEGFFEHIFGV